MSSAMIQKSYLQLTVLTPKLKFAAQKRLGFQLNWKSTQEGIILPLKFSVQPGTQIDYRIGALYSLDFGYGATQNPIPCDIMQDTAHISIAPFTEIKSVDKSQEFIGKRVELMVITF